MKPVRSCLAWACIVAGLSVGYRLPKSTVFDGLEACENIYLYDSLLLVSDAVHGLVVYSVANPSAPNYLQTIRLTEHSGVAAVNGVVFANSAGAILALSLESDTTYKVLSVIRPSPYYGDGYPPMNDYHEGGIGCAGPAEVSYDSPAASRNGAGGSYAVFAVSGSYLYYLRGSSLVTIDIANPAQPEEIGELHINWSVETIFSTGDHLYIGAPDGMFIVDIEKPSQPELIANVGHFRSCDPVVVQGSYAYVTLRAGGICGGTQSRLMVVDVADPAKPRTVYDAPVSTAWGLCVRNNHLYVAFGTAGHGLYDISAPDSPRATKTWETYASKDFIWQEDLLYTMGFDRITILDVSDPNVPRPVGAIR